MGRLIPEKGVQTIIKAMYALPDKYRLMIVGDGPCRPMLEDMAAEVGDRVIFLGARSDVPRLLDLADVFVHMPEWKEGFGITVVEAMAAGKICIVANSGAMPEIITDGVDGFIIEKGNPQALADCVGNISNLNVCSIRENAKKRAGYFSIEKYSKCLDQEILRDR